MGCVAAEEWNNGFGPILEMSVYPTYAVVTQGSQSTGGAGCLNANRWTVDWSQMDTATANRIFSLLMTVYTTKASFLAVIDGASCGQEGYKRAVGKFYFPPS